MGKHTPLRERKGAWWSARAEVVRVWIRRAAAAAPPGWALKTDLFDEASGPYHHADDLDPTHRFLGIDMDLRVARAARARLAAEGKCVALVVADVRALPFARESLSLVVSLSTLDHLQTEGDIAQGLRELRRSLAREGVLLLTLDNPYNPEVALRARLPAWLVRRLRADTFSLGVTLPPDVVGGLLTSLGYRIREGGFLIHAPRYPLIRLARWLERFLGRRSDAFLARVILAFEALASWPTARLTGHYVGWIADVRDGGRGGGDG